MDKFSKKKRSEIMSRIRSRNTKVELVIFRELRRRSVHFQKHYKRAPGSPDIALPRKKKAVFIDGDFWHGHNFSKLQQRLPPGFWVEKIERNIKRDRRIRAKLRRAGWDVLRLWEHAIAKDLELTVDRIEGFLKRAY